jgi:hypothetical protein
MFRFHVCAARCAALAYSVVSLAILAGSAAADFTEFSVGGSTPASIQATVDAFRAALGNPNNANNPGPIVGGRREINWDGGGAVTAAASGSTLTAFQNTRGATFTTPGTGFLQTPLDVAELTGINPTYSTLFTTFSPVRIFTPTGSNITDATFSLPGTAGATPATISGFGAVFTDVDLANVTKMEFFDLGGNSLDVLNVPQGVAGTAPNGSLSFMGGIANAGERIARVRITTGNSALGPNDLPVDNVDIVAMDDFLYSEPIAVPEPASLLLVIGALGCSAMSRRCR